MCITSLHFLKLFFSGALLVQKQVIICSCDVQKIISPAIVFILVMKRSCQDSNVGIIVENRLDALKKKKKIFLLKNNYLD